MTLIHEMPSDIPPKAQSQGSLPQIEISVIHNDTKVTAMKSPLIECVFDLCFHEKMCDHDIT